jgi:hypothetical protein
MNKVFRKCLKCSYENIADIFSYLGDGVFSCPSCLSKYTEIVKIEGESDE